MAKRKKYQRTNNDLQPMGSVMFGDIKRGIRSNISKKNRQYNNQLNAVVLYKVDIILSKMNRQRNGQKKKVPKDKQRSAIK
jgi:hypothetical protein